MYGKTDGDIQQERDSMDRRMKEARDRVRTSVEETDSQKLKMIKMQNDYVQEKKSLENEIHRLQEENKRLREKHTRLMEQVKHDEANLTKKYL